VQSGKDSPFYQRWIVRTKNLSIFDEFFFIYYAMNSLGKNVKIIPLNIEQLLCPILLANFIMSDGNYHKLHGYIRLYTNSFTLVEVQLLSTAIFNKYGIQSRVQHDRREQYILLFPRTQVAQLQELVKAHMIPSMLYRIGL
jgi:hypothetical protein